MKRMCVVVLATVACGCSTSRPLFNGKDLTGWVEVGSTGAWSVEDGILKCNGQKAGYAWLSTDRMYGDFELELDWRIPAGTNAGVFLRAPDRKSRTSMWGMEAQIKDDAADKDFTDISGSVFQRIPAAGRFSRPIGEWNRYKLMCTGRRLRIELNGQLCSDTDIDTVPPQGDDRSMTLIPDEGYIGLQNHGQPVAFRDIRIREMP
jgi:hypothetical protein